MWELNSHLKSVFWKHRDSYVDSEFERLVDSEFERYLQNASSDYSDFKVCEYTEVDCYAKVNFFEFQNQAFRIFFFLK